MTPEGRVKATIKAALQRIGAWYFMPAMNGMGRAGIPDFVGCWRGRFFAIEAKRPGGKPTAWQTKELEAIKAAGGLCAVVSSEEELGEFLKGLTNGYDTN